MAALSSCGRKMTVKNMYQDIEGEWVITSIEVQNREKNGLVLSDTIIQTSGKLGFTHCEYEGNLCELRYNVGSDSIISFNYQLQYEGNKYKEVNISDANTPVVIQSKDNIKGSYAIDVLSKENLILISQIESPPLLAVLFDGKTIKISTKR